MFKFFGVGEDDAVAHLEKDIESSQEQEGEVGQIALDILETEYEFIILAPIAGIELEDIDVSFNKSVLTISGVRQQPEFYRSDDTELKNSECYWGKFVRNIILPENLDFDDIKATMENNLLQIVIKKIQFNSQNIKINRIEI